MCRCIFKYQSKFKLFTTIVLLTLIGHINTLMGNDYLRNDRSALNTAPEITAPTTQAILENGVLTFSTASNNAIEITDTDNDDQTVTITMDEGILTLSQTTGLTFLNGTSDGSSSLKFEGSLIHINAALAGALYQPQDKRGTFTLDITTNDGISDDIKKSITIQSVIQLSPGDLAFTGFNADGDDGFAFVLLKAIDGSSIPAILQFTDKSWNGSAFSDSEGSIQWTVTSHLTAGTVVAFQDLTGSKTATHGTIETTGSSALSGTNENLFAFVGTLEQPLVFLAALSNDGDDGWGTLEGTGLTQGTNAIDIGLKDRDADIATYIGGRNSETDFASYLSLTMNLDHWEVQDGTGDQSNDGIDPDLPFDITSFTINNSPPVLTESNPSDDRKGFNLGSPITLNFSKTVVKGNGNINVRKSDDDSLIESISVGSPEVTINGNTVTITRSLVFDQATSYYIIIDDGTFEDELGNTYTGITGKTSLNFSTADVVINEVVTDPEQDWSANDFNGTAVDVTGSQGKDEFLELFIKTAGVDFTGWTLELIDGTDVIGDLTSKGAFAVSNYLSNNGGSFTTSAAGDFLVLGNVAGSGAMNNDVHIKLKDPAGIIVDEVKLGGGLNEAPDGGADGILDESVQRKPNGTDTNNDASDFVKAAATMGQATDDTNPTLISATKDNNTQITLTLSEPIQTQQGHPTDFKVIDDNNTNFEVTAQADGSALDDKIVLTVSDLSAAQLRLIVTYTNNNNEIRDLGGNPLATDITGVEIALNAPPTSTNVSINGTLEQGETLTGIYDWSDIDVGDVETGSTFRWLRENLDEPGVRAAIPGATAKTYEPVAEDLGKKLIFEVTPSDGKSFGAATQSQAFGPIKTDQLITFNALSSRTYGDAAFSLNAASDAGLAINYASSDPQVATISNGNEVTIVGAGSTTITASQAGNNQFFAATDVQQTLTINKATLTVTAEDKSKAYGEENPALTFSYTGFKNGEDQSVLDTQPDISTTATTTTDVGTVPISLNGGSDNNYDFTLNNGTLTIGKATLTVTAGNKSKTYGEENPALTLSYEGFKNEEDESVLDTEPGISTTATATTDVGTVPITLAGGSDNNYDFLLNNGTLNIDKATLTVTAEDKSKAYGEENPLLTLSYAGFKNGEDQTVIDTQPTINSAATATTDVGTVPIIVSGGTDNNYDFILINGTLTISKATLSVTAEDKSKTYGEENPALTFSYVGFKNGEDESVLDTQPDISTTATATTDVGTVPITLTGGSDNNYDFVLNNGALTIGKATLTVTAEDKSREYGEENPALTLSYAGFKNGEDQTVIDTQPTINSAATATTDVGTVPIIVSGETDNNYDFILINGTLTISKATLSVTAEDKSKTYGEENPALTLSYSGFKNGENKTVLNTEPSISTTATATTDVGTVPISLTGGSDNNYNFILNNGTLTINKATLTVTAEDKSKTYGEENPTLTLSYAGFRNGEDQTVIDTQPGISTTATATTDVGTVPISLTGGSDNNYDFALNNGTLTIEKATLTVTADDKSKAYGEENPELTFSYAGFKNGEDESVLDTEPDISTTATATTDVGTVPITLSGGNDNNYDFTLNNGTLTISKATLTVTAEEKSKTYGEENPVLTFSYAGFKNGEDQSALDSQPNISTSATASTHVGTVSITLNGGSDNNYDFVLNNGTLTIGKATLTVTAEDKSKAYGEENPALTFSYAGFKNGEDQSVLDTQPGISTTATTSTDVGTVPIILAGGSDNNYDFTLKNGTLTISKATLSVTAEDKNKAYGEENPALTFSYAGFKNGEDESVLETQPGISTTATATTDVGTVPITLGGGSDNNYDFILINGTLTISKATLTVTAEDKSKAYGEENPELTFSYNGFKNGENKTVLNTPPGISTTATASTDVGTVPITLTGGSDNNYDFTLINGTLTISKAALNVTAEDKSKAYGEENPALTLSYTGFKNGENETVLDTPPDISTTATTTTDVGAVPIIVSGGSDNNYDFILNNGTLTISKATLTVTAEDKNKVYGEENPALTFSYAGFRNGEDQSVIDTKPTINSAATATTDAGTVPITLSGGSDSNYDFILNNGTLTIEKATLTVTAEDKNKVYGEENPALTFSYAGFRNGEDQSVIDTKPTINSAATATTDAGTVPITLSGGTDNNYNFILNNGTLTINKANLTVTAEDKSKAYGEENPAFTLSYTGFKNSEDQSVIDTEPGISTTATATTDVGTVPISLTGGSDNNYDFTLINGTLTIGKATLTVTAEDKSKAYGEENPALTLSYEGFKNGEDQSVLDTEPSINTTATATTDVGTAPITLTGGSDNNYDFDFRNGALLIQKALITAQAQDTSRFFGEANPSFTILFSGFKNGENASIFEEMPFATSPAQKKDPPGDYPILVAGGNAKNYTFQHLNGTLSVLPTEPPKIIAITRAEENQLPNEKRTASFWVSFTKAVQDLNVSSFNTQLTGTATGVINSVSTNTRKRWLIRLIGITGQGTVGLKLKEDHGIQDDAGQPLEDSDFKNEVYTINWIPTDIHLSRQSIDENNSTGEIIGVLSTEDQDAADRHTYRFDSGVGSADNEAFKIVDNELQAVATFDFETQNNFSIRIATDDGHGGVLSKTFTIEINNVIEPGINILGDSIFTQVPLGTSLAKAWRIFNTGEKDVEITVASLPESFRFEPETFTLPLSDSIVVNVFFEPIAEDTIQGNVILAFDDEFFRKSVRGEGAIITSIDSSLPNAEQMQLFPNPAQHIITVKLPLAAGLVSDISIYNQQGRLIFTTKMEDPYLDIRIDRWPTGIYLLQRISENTVERQRFQIIR